MQLCWYSSTNDNITTQFRHIYGITVSLAVLSHQIHATFSFLDFKIKKKNPNWLKQHQNRTSGNPNTGFLPTGRPKLTSSVEPQQTFKLVLLCYPLQPTFFPPQLYGLQAQYFLQLKQLLEGLLEIVVGWGKASSFHGKTSYTDLYPTYNIATELKIMKKPQAHASYLFKLNFWVNMDIADFTMKCLVLQSWAFTAILHLQPGAWSGVRLDGTSTVPSFDHRLVFWA